MKSIYQLEGLVNELADRIASKIAEKIRVSMQPVIPVQPPPFHPSQNTEERFVTTEELIKRLKVSRSTIWRLQQSGKFPESRNVFAGRKVWLESEVEQWMRGANPKPRSP